MYAPETQILCDIDCASEENWVKIHCKDGKTIEAFAEFFTYESVGDDENVDALLLTLRDGTHYVIIGDDVKSFEILENDKRSASARGNSIAVECKTPKCRFGGSRGL